MSSIDLFSVRVKGNIDGKNQLSGVDLWAVLWYNKLNDCAMNGGKTMNFLIRTAVLLAAGAAGWALAKRKSKPAENTDPHVVYLKDDEAVINAQAEPSEPEAVAAEVLSCYRRMNPLTLTGASDVTFILADGTEVKLQVSGEGGLHLAKGDQGLLAWSGKTLIRFEKNNGEVVGGMFYMPAQEGTDDE